MDISVSINFGVRVMTKIRYVPIEDVIGKLVCVDISPCGRLCRTELKMDGKGAYVETRRGIRTDVKDGDEIYINDVEEDSLDHCLEKVILKYPE
jgi:hypothetical protein